MLMMMPPLLWYFWFHSIYSLAASCSLQSAVCGDDDGLFHVSFIWNNTPAIQNGKHYTCTNRSSPLADWFHTETGGHAFCVYMILLQNFVSEQNSRSGTTTRVNCAGVKVAPGSCTHPLKVSNTSIIICSLVQYLLVNYIDWQSRSQTPWLKCLP